ncbi:MAG: MFS transporter, partial [Candidatus Electrothrix sp. ATG2]|nr:MFS transporter [Candidatus Electrothrix sp. ATG2]
TAYILYAVALLLIPCISSLPMLLFPVVLFGIAQGLNIPSVQTMLATLAPLEYRASFMAVNGMVLRLGQTLGPLLMGMFFVLWGIDGAFFAGVGCAFFMLAALVVVLNKSARFQHSTGKNMKKLFLKTAFFFYRHLFSAICLPVYCSPTLPCLKYSCLA